MTKKKKVLVTGSGGFIFSNFIRRAFRTKQPLNISSLDRVREGQEYNVYLNSDHHFYICDIRDPHVLNVVFKTESPDIVVHGAAESVHEQTIIPFRHRKVEHIEIKDLWDRFSKNNDVEIPGEKTQVINLDPGQHHTLTVKNGIGQWRLIKQISRHWYSGKMIHMRQKWGEIDVTPNHSIYDSNMNITRPSADVEMLSLRQIQRTHSKDKTPKNFGGIPWNGSLDDLLFLIAFYVTEGCAHFNTANGAYLIDFSQKTLSELHRIDGILKKEFSVKPYLNRRDHVNDASHIVISNKRLYNAFIEECGQYSENKKLPSFVFRLGEKNLRKLIEYMIGFDGHKYTETNKKYSTNSRVLCAQLCTLLSLANLNYSYSRTVFENEKWKDAYCIQISDRYNSLNNMVYDEYDYEGWVYDLEVDDTHKFVSGLGNVVVHNSFVDSSINDAQPFVTTNVVGTQNIIEACLRWDVKKLIYISTDEVYGHLTSESEPAWTEEAALNPRNPHAASKASGELLVMAAHKTHGLTYNITRCCNNYGPWQHREKMLPKIIKSVLHGEKMPIYGQGLQVRDWLHVHDNCDALYTIISDGYDNETYNISAGFELTNIELFQKVCNIIEEQKGPRGHELIEFVKDRPGHDFRYSMDSSKLRNIGWKPKLRLSDGLNQTISWYISNQFCLKED